MIYNIKFSMESSSSFQALTDNGSCQELVPIRSKAKPPSHITKRGYSYSDSFYFNKDNILEPTFTISDSTINQYVNVKEDNITALENNESKIICIIIGFIFHIFLISLFETIFFFFFISKSEDSGIIHTINSYVNDISNSCSNWNTNQTIIINDILQLFINTTIINNNAIIANNNRSISNNKVFFQSWIYTISIASTFCIITVISIYFKKLNKNSIKKIFFENIGLVSMLGLYEFIFFKTIIYNYTAITAPEIDQYVVNTLQQKCSLFNIY